MSPRYLFRYFQGVRYVAPHNPAPATFARCLSCYRAWDDDNPTGLTPTPAGRCPFEYWHRSEADAKPRARRTVSPAPRARRVEQSIKARTGMDGRLKATKATLQAVARCPGCACSGSPRDLALCRPPLAGVKP